MSVPKMSVIIPVYKVEDLLEKCVSTITASSFSDFEILLVDDGSTDKSAELCDALAKNDSRILVFKKENGGLSDARNFGLDRARGELICFVDSDDFVEAEHFTTLLDLIEKYDADISVGGICNCYESRRVPQCEALIENVCSGEEALGKMLEGVEISGSSCCKLIKRELLENRYFIVGKTYEDAFYLPELMLSAKRVAYTTKPLYNYWHRRNSITTKPFNERAMDVVDAYNYTAELIEKKGLNSLRSLADFRIWWANFVVLDRMLLMKNFRKLPQYKEVVSRLKSDWLKILRCPHFQKSRRIAAVALKINVELYRMLGVIKAKRDGNN